MQSDAGRAALGSANWHVTNQQIGPAVIEKITIPVSDFFGSSHAQNHSVHQYRLLPYNGNGIPPASPAPIPTLSTNPDSIAGIHQRSTHFTAIAALLTAIQHDRE